MNSRKRNRIAWRNLFIPFVILTGCEPDARASGERSVVDVILTVSNQSRRAAHVSLQSDTLQRLLGDVASGASQSFSLPTALVRSSSPLRLEAIGAGGMAVQSETFGVRRGEQVVWSFADTGRGSLVRK
jgi:hypothetical protein